MEGFPTILAFRAGTVGGCLMHCTLLSHSLGLNLPETRAGLSVMNQCYFQSQRLVKTNVQARKTKPDHFIIQQKTTGKVLRYAGHTR